MGEGLDAKHAAFTEWAKEQGVAINGVKPAVLPGKGIGIVATQAFKKDEALVSIPAAALITHDTPFVRDAKLPKDMTVYGAVAAALTLNHGSEDRWYRLWQDTWPTRKDFEESMPLCWNTAQQGLLPATAQDLLEKQRAKFESDLVVMENEGRMAAELGKDWKGWYRYYWLVVNTRCFYWVYFRKAQQMARKGKKLARDECLALVPWGDYFNHADHGCQVVENESGATVVADRNYAKGEEVVVSYGAHSNDYLLVEYGFILSSNSWDNTSIDHFILPLLNASQRDLLEQHGYLGDYFLSAQGLCYRSEVAIRTMITTPKRLDQFLLGEYDGEKEDKKYQAKLKDIFRLVQEQSQASLTAAMRGKSISSNALTERWRQILIMLDQAKAEMLDTKA